MSGIAAAERVASRLREYRVLEAPAPLAALEELVRRAQDVARLPIAWISRMRERGTVSSVPAPRAVAPASRAPMRRTMRRASSVARPMLRPSDSTMPAAYQAKPCAGPPAQPTGGAPTATVQP